MSAYFTLDEALRQISRNAWDEFEAELASAERTADSVLSAYKPRKGEDDESV